MWLVPLLLIATQAWGLGLGEIRLSSALNQPLRAEIELLAATPEELANLTIQLASVDTFQRYDLDRPNFLSRLQFQVLRTGRADGNVIRVTSPDPVTEPFVTFLVEAVWSRGRLLREYTLLLDPPTFAPPPVTQSSQAVEAPRQSSQSDAGRIEREPAPAAPPRQQAPAPAAPARPAQTAPSTPAASTPVFDSTPGNEITTQRGDTLWGIANRLRPDNRLTMNQTMLAIYQANPQAFGGNINLLRAGAVIRVPSADDIFRISRGEALAEVQRQNTSWDGGTVAPSPTPAPPPSEPSLTLVPPDDEDDVGVSDDDPGTVTDDPVDDAVDVSPLERIVQIQSILQDDDALLSITDDELAALRSELADLGGEDPSVTDEPPADQAIDDVFVDDSTVDDEAPIDDAVEDEVAEPAPAVVRRPADRDEGIVDTLLGYLSNFWVWVGAALLATVLILTWFMRRAGGGDDMDMSGTWTELDDEPEPETKTSTERLQAIARDDESIVVVESGQDDGFDAAPGTVEIPMADDAAPQIDSEIPHDPLSDTDAQKSLEDTFSSETAINLDQSDPIAEADFHMAYGLYDQAADLVNGALAADPDRPDLLAKLCEIYFVWGNRDAFVDAASRLKAQIGGDGNPAWDKTVIMGQQIAGDHEMFSGVTAGAATREVDLSFDGDSSDTNALDMDFAGDSDGVDDDVIDLGADDAATDDDSALDFSLGDSDVSDLEASATREMPERTVESPTIEAEVELDATGELPAMRSGEPAVETDATAEINLDDLGLDIGDLDETSVAVDGGEDTFADFSGDDAAVTGKNVALDEEDASDATGTIEELLDEDSLAATGKNPAMDLGDDPDATGTRDSLSLDEALAATGEVPSFDDGTGLNRALPDDAETLLASLDDDDDAEEATLDSSLLDATGQTQVLPDDVGVETGAGLDDAFSDDDTSSLLANDEADNAASTDVLPDDAETMLASLDDDDEIDFDFAKTEALPKESFSSDMSNDETGNLPGLAGSTDLDLDLDDLTAALKVSEVGDTVNQVRDDATVEQPRIKPGGNDSSETSVTQALNPDDMSGDLHDARTMTEVGTKLDLARAYVDMGDPGGARSILEEVLDEGDESQKQQAQQLLESLPD